MEVIYGFEGILIRSDRTQCEVCFETEAASLTLSPPARALLSPLSCLPHRQPSVKEDGRLARGACQAFAFGQQNALQMKTMIEEKASLAIFLMTTDLFILSVTPRREAGAVPSRALPLL